MRTPDSIKAKLRQLSIVHGKPFDFFLAHYFIERALYRLAMSPYAEHFILKGGMLLHVVLDNDARATRDIDMLGHRIEAEAEHIVPAAGLLFHLRQYQVGKTVDCV